jgi:3-oxoacyl-[acyl-carrier protein] reductase
MIQGQMKATAVEHRIATTDDIAPIVGWLAGDEAKWISGQAISASGGLVMP